MNGVKEEHTALVGAAKANKKIGDRAKSYEEGGNWSTVDEKNYQVSARLVTDCTLCILYHLHLPPSCLVAPLPAPNDKQQFIKYPNFGMKEIDRKVLNFKFDV